MTVWTRRSQGGVGGDQSPSLDRTHTQKLFKKTIKCQKTNRKTLNSSVILPELQIRNVKTFAFFENFFQGH